MMKQFLPVLAVTLVVTLTVASGWIHGKLNSRWGPPQTMCDVAKKLESLPASFSAGDPLAAPGEDTAASPGAPAVDSLLGKAQWVMKSDDPMDPYALKMLRCAGYVNRTYEHSITGAAIRMSIILGPSGEVAVHTPEVCFASRQYEEAGERLSVAIECPNGSKGEFWSNAFQPRDKINGQPVCVFYAWSTGGPWLAAEGSTLRFSGRPYLYKIQLSAADEGLCRSFLQDLIPVAKPYLVELGAD